MKNAKEVLIPKSYRDELKSLLHSTHLSDNGMIQLARGKFFWPSIRSELKDLYKECEECLVHSPSKPQPPYEISPSPLELLSPNETVYLDYMSILNTDILVIKDKMSGFIYSRITKDKSIASTIETFHRYITTFDRPLTVITDGGPAFNHGFMDFLNAHHIHHRYSSAYHPQSNSPAERGVHSLKDVIIKVGKIDDKLLR